MCPALPLGAWTQALVKQLCRSPGSVERASGLGMGIAGRVGYTGGKEAWAGRRSLQGRL